MSAEHITTPLADEGNYTYCQSRGAHNIKHIYLRGRSFGGKKIWWKQNLAELADANKF